MDTTGQGGWKEPGDWDWYIGTIDTVCKIDNQWERTLEHRELYLSHSGDLHGKDV